MAKIDVSQWGEFKVGELFDVSGTKSTDAGHVDLISSGDAQFVGRTADNNGVQGYVNSSDFNFKPNEVNTISVSQVGTIIAQYRDYPYFTSQNILKLSSDSLNQNVATFVCSVINTRLAQLGFIGYNTLKQAVLKKLAIKLPITLDGEPDWEYMDNYIVKLAARAHKDVSSLNRVKSKPHKINIDNWQKFKIGDVFEKLTTKSYIRHQLKSDLATSKSAEFSLPLVYAKYDNNGIMYYDKPDNHESHGHCLSVIYNGAVSAGLVFPQVSPVGVWAEAYLLRCKYDIDDACLFYLAAVLQRVTYYKYSRDDLAVWSKVKYDYIFLPVTPSGQPDFDYMKKYIEMVQASVKCRLQSYQNVK